MERLTLVDEKGRVLFSPEGYGEDEGYTIIQLAESGHIGLLEEIAEKFANYEQRLKEYEDIGLTPEQLIEVDRLYAEKCKELAELEKKSFSGIEMVKIWANLQKLKEYKELEDNGKLLKLPCAVGDTVYVLAECENIPAQLDGTLHGKNGEPGTATGYYCPYEDNCPFDDEDFEDCEKYKGKTAVFEDTVGDITVGEDGIWIRTENCGVCSQIGLYIFLTMEEADAALEELKRK